MISSRRDSPPRSGRALATDIEEIAGHRAEPIADCLVEGGAPLGGIVDGGGQRNLCRQDVRRLQGSIGREGGRRPSQKCHEVREENHREAELSREKRRCPASSTSPGSRPSAFFQDDVQIGLGSFDRRESANSRTVAAETVTSAANTRASDEYSIQ